MSAGVFTPVAAALIRKPPMRRRVRTPVISATAGDHAAIYCFLRDIFWDLSRTEFRSELDDPFYEPCDRLYLRRAGRIIAHVHLTRRVMQFGPVQFPVAGLDRLATYTDCCGQGLGTHLLVAAEKRMAQDGAPIGLLRTKIPGFFQRTGWAVCGQHHYSLAGTHAIMGRLIERGLRPGRHTRYHIRPTRRWEENSLARIYNQNLTGSYGPLERTGAYWHWLLRRHAYDQLYVALDGPNLWDLEERNTTLVGYAAVKGAAIVELMTAPGRKRAAGELLARICGDAIEQDLHALALHGPADGPLADVFQEAGGRRLATGTGSGGSARLPTMPEHGEVYMARLLDPLGFLARTSDELVCRANAARLPRPLELGLLVDGHKYQIELTRQAARTSAMRLGRSYLRLGLADLTRLVLGQLDWEQALAKGSVEPSTALAEEAGRALFPRLPLWRPPLDDLPA
jgi:predicted N-acetyltransferase YhbS